MLQGSVRGMKKGEQSLGFIAHKKENLSSITSFLLSFKMNSCPARVCPSLVVYVGLTDLPSPLCLYPPISMVKSLQDVCVSTLLLLEREAVEEERGESPAAWVCAFLLEEAGAESGCWSSLGAPRCGCFGTGYFP